ncbi:MAG: ABC-F type ribosomal protection protein [Firmicutes bacterium]|nr:ABC-F type ribosomal protection protein [Bacillota bacterium]
MSLINVRNLTFSYPGSFDNVFENVSFQIDTCWKLGFTGRNGRGKTTFLKLLMGLYDYSGTIDSNVKFQYFPLEVKNANDTVFNIINEHCPTLMEWEILKEFSQLKLEAKTLCRPFSTLSGGETVKVLLAALFMSGGFLLIDEPTNHIDMETRQIVAEYLRSKSGFILVSHDRSLLDECTDHTLAINKTNIEIHKGTFSTWWENKQNKDAFEEAENEKLKKDIKRLEFSAQKKANWSNAVEKTKFGHKLSGIKPDKGYIGHKAAKMMKRSKSIENRRQQAVEKKSSLLKNIESSETLKLSQLDYHKHVLAEFKNISLYYSSEKVCENISFSVEKCDRICISGPNGCGKSSVLKLMTGQKIEYTGEFKIGSGLKMSFVSQDVSHLSGTLSQLASSKGIEEHIFKAVLRKLDFSREQFEKDMKFFSDGQKKKVALAASLCEHAHIHVWDEPLNFIDVISRIQIEELILESQPTIIFVEHDRKFRDNIATKIVEI